jgi:hypothetical protein
MIERTEPSPEVLIHAFEIAKDTELTSSMLGALGLYNAQLDVLLNPPEAPQLWYFDTDEKNIVRGWE